MAAFDALLDSNVIVATVAQEHQHHVASADLFDGTSRFAVAPHSYAEAYNALTRRGEGAAFQRPAEKAWAALESVAAATTLVGLSPAQTFDAIRGYAEAGGIGARLYGRLIGQVAMQHAILRIVTWNVRHMRGLFPELEVVDPLMAMDP